MTSTFPGQVARTQGFTLGLARNFAISPDGSRVVFLRSAGGEDPVAGLWILDVATGEERLLADPAALGATGAGPMSERERARRERARDRSAGISAFTTDAGVRTIAFTLDMRLYVADVSSGEVTEVGAREPVAEARIDPTGTWIAYVHEDELRVVGRDGKDDRPLAEPDGPEVTWGLPEHEASESMDRFQGYWWAPDGRSLVAARVDNSPVQVWYISDPAHPEKPPTALRYPAAGTPNADVSLHVLGLDGSRVEIDWDRRAFEYVTRVTWDATALLIAVQNRPQTVMRILTADPATGRTTVLREDTDPHWTTIVSGLPAHTASGALLWTVEDGDTRRLTVDGVPVTPPGLQIDRVLSVDGDTVLFAAFQDPSSRDLWTWSPASLQQVTTVPGLHEGRRRGGVTVVEARTLDAETVTVDGRPLRSVAAVPSLVPRPRLHWLGERRLRTAVLLPTGYTGGTLPVLMDPYGGRAAQRAVAARSRYWASQWFADQGFAVVIADGRGTPGRGPTWDRARGDDHPAPRLQDQVDALHAAAGHYDLDLNRVAIRGWSAGGYLAALAVLRRPDVFHAGIAGAPVTDMLLYSSHWQERTLGLPAENPGMYAQSSLIDDAPNLRRPLLLIHGLVDDNVLPVHTMKLSAALLAAGRPHTVLPLPGASHMGVVDGLWEYELAFLRQSLGLS
ncbi:S9 family peptidase [Actinoplanes xinjiangensis]|uniref:Dipeptidyl-peptidase-4 n=1 Tax=Actinoplanes xinjiangensis TaxID=512350 RepID=A0A316FD21_9ACTN|nr:prolyl oligopeptidase family serine peptidase [Actinoplanes xinjiangensis]PWK45074.1 dipeptidyl-peptidase-4 [Actinoplanes xinjiangensis]GIF41589.1 peptidase [Actinoplanes xinjiangensis]